MRKIEIEVPDKDCKNCDLASYHGIHYLFLECPFREVRDARVKNNPQPVKACRDAEVA